MQKHQNNHPPTEKPNPTKQNQKPLNSPCRQISELIRSFKNWGLGKNKKPQTVTG